MNILEKIIEYKKTEINQAKKNVPLNKLLENIASNCFLNNSLLKTVQSDSKFHFICEIKKASPSKGVFQTNFNPEALARDYTEGGASAISVLTDKRFFQGSLDILSQVKKLTSLPVLRKDFIFEEYQIYEAKSAGTDLVLLIAKILTLEQIKKFCQLASDLDMDVLLELYEEKEILKIPDNYPVLIGINNRNLDTFEVNFSHSINLKKKIPQSIPVISESGIQTIQNCRLLKNEGFRGVLIGETLMKSKNPRHVLKRMVEKVNNVH
jgi:indole-3-glycerol phosphate synthase